MFININQWDNLSWDLENLSSAGSLTSRSSLFSKGVQPHGTRLQAAGLLCVAPWSSWSYNFRRCRLGMIRIQLCNHSISSFLHVSSWRTCFENSLYAAVEINHRGDCAEEIPPSPPRLSLVTPTLGRTSQGEPGQKGAAWYLLTRPFSFQSPASMKSVLQAGWLLTVAVGNTLVLVVAQAAPMAQVWFGS